MDDRELRELLDDAMAEEGAAGRRRRRALAHVQAEDAGLAGTLLDLAEAGEVVVVRTTSGRSHRGRILLVGIDVVVVEGPVQAWIRLLAVTSVTTSGRVTVATGARTGADLRFTEAMARLAEDRPQVTVVLPGDTVVGELVGVGTDVLTLRPAGAGGVVYVSAVAATEVLRSG